jgi:UDP-N-acetylmuramoyl-tripeptide--D-alanyl-D-alanine ligase
MAAIALGRYFKIHDKHIIKAIEGYIPANSRSQQLITGNNHLFLDAYNANPVSMSEALRSFHHYGAENPWVILGDMFELGSSAEKEHQHIVDLIGQLKFKNVILIGKHFLGFKSNRYLFFETTGETLAYLKENPVRQANILIKGSRGMKLEQLIPVL